ncbi:MAG: efflux RND transporter periplasmic adaptor subunit [Paracoccaceae bacterium]|nr:efflux RND transporter periplasmic adaptor subunit [Paracoccaceae bacterium]
MRFFGRSLIGLLMVALTAGLLALAGSTFYSALEERFSKEVKKRPARERVFSADVLTIKKTNISPVINSFGEIRSNRTLELRAPSGGTIVMLSKSFEEGGIVGEGELLIKIDPADAQTSVDVARADLAEAEVQLVDARGSLQLSEDELSVDVARADLAEAEVSFTDASGSLQLAKDELSVDVARADLAEAKVSFMDASGSLQLANDELSVDVAKADLLEAEVQLMDSSGYVKLAKEELIAAENQLELKERAFTRQKDLKRRGVVTDAAVETAELSVSTSKQAVLSRKQASHKAEIQLEQSGNIVNRKKLNVSDAVLSRREAIQKAKLKLEQSGNVVNRRKLNLADAELSRRDAIQKAKLKLEQSGNVVNRMKLNLANAELSRREAIQKAKLKLEQSGNVVNRMKLNLADAELSRREAIQKAKLKLEQSGNVVNRMKLNLANAELSRREAIQKAKLKLEQSSNLVSRRKLNLANAERLLSDTELYAEFGGRLAEVNVTSGGLVNNNERLAKLIDPDDLEVSFRLSTTQYNYLTDEKGLLIGSLVEVALDTMGADLKVTGTLTRESASVVEGASGRLLFAKLNEPVGLRPGDFVSVSVQEPVLKNIFIMPASAIGQNDTILLVNAEDRLEERTVELLRRQGENIVIRSDDLDGKEVVSKYSQLLGKGIKIKPIRAKVAGEEVFSGPEMVELDDKRRARLIAAVEANAYIPKNVKKKILTALSKKKVRADMIERLEK